MLKPCIFVVVLRLVAFGRWREEDLVLREMDGGWRGDVIVVGTSPFSGGCVLV
jgi:hypothetical protein